MALNVKSFTRLVQDQAAAVQTKCSSLVDFTVGSVLRAIVESNAAVGLWLQGIIIYVAKLTRLATSTGTDVDSFLNDFGVFRLQNSVSAGSVTFSRFVATSAAVIPVGAQVQSADGTQTFNVIADATNAAFNIAAASPNGGYIIPITVPSVTVAVQSANAGTAANVLANTVNVMLTSIPFVDYCNNAADMAGGSDSQSDPAARAYFVLFINQLSKGTKLAIGYAITSLQLGIQYTLTENKDYSGATDYGYFYAVIDDGTGTPPASLLTAAANAIDSVRAFTVNFAVFAPVVVTANVSMTLSVASGYDAPTVKGQVGNAITSYITNLGLGNALNYTRLAQIAYDTTPGVTDVQNLLLNSGTSDIAANKQNTIKPGTIAVN